MTAAITSCMLHTHELHVIPTTSTTHSVSLLILGLPLALLWLASLSKSSSSTCGGDKEASNPMSSIRSRKSDPLVNLDLESKVLMKYYRYICMVIQANIMLLNTNKPQTLIWVISFWLLSPICNSALTWNSSLLIFLKVSWLLKIIN